MTTPNTNVTKGTLMVVDDDADNLELMEFSLLRQGYEVIKAASMCEAVETFRSSPYPIRALITDYWLGDGTGAELVTHLGESAPSVRILVSGSSEIRTNRTFDAFLVKPVLPNRLQEVLADLLHERAV